MSKKLQVLTRDKLYAVMLREVQFRWRWSEIDWSAGDFASLTHSPAADLVLIAASHFDQVDLAKTVLRITALCPESAIALLVDTIKPRLVLVRSNGRVVNGDSLDFSAPTNQDLEKGLNYFMQAQPSSWFNQGVGELSGFFYKLAVKSGDAYVSIPAHPDVN